MRLVVQVYACSNDHFCLPQDECSFVSLRDVERAMIVFEYMYRMMGVFGPLMDEYARGEVRIIDNEDDDEVSIKPDIVHMSILA